MDVDLISATLRIIVDIKLAKMKVERRYSLIISANIINLNSSGKNESNKAKIR